MNEPTARARVTAALLTELRFVWGAFWGPLKGCVLLGAGLGLLLFFVGLTGGEHSLGLILFSFVFWPAYGGWYGVMLGVPAGVIRLVWRLAGPWAFAPILLVPACLGLALWLSGPAIGWLGQSFVDALLAGMDGHEALLAPYVQGIVGHGGGLHGPGAEIGLAILLALFSVEFVWLVLSTPPALGWLVALLGTILLVAIAGLVPPAVVSGVMVARGVWRRMRARHGGGAASAGVGEGGA